MYLRAALLCCDPELSGFLVLHFFGEASILLPCSFCDELPGGNDEKNLGKDSSDGDEAEADEGTASSGSASSSCCQREAA